MPVNFFELKDDSMIFTKDYMEVYIPQNLFKKDLNEIYGDIVHVMGIFNFRVGNKDGEIDKNSKVYTFNFPSMFNTKPSSIEEKEMKLVTNSPTTKYYVLKYYKNDKMMVSTEIIQDISNLKVFINLLLAGTIPPTIEYESILKMFYKCMEINNETANVTGLVLSIIVSEICRFKKDETIPFRRIIGNNKYNVSQLDYKMCNYRQVCANTSTFTAITFEDIDTMLAYSINRKRYNKKSIKSPNEELLEV